MLKCDPSYNILSQIGHPFADYLPQFVFAMVQAQEATYGNYRLWLSTGTGRLMAVFGTILLSMILAAGTSVGALLFADVSWAGGIVLYLVLSSLFAVILASVRMLVRKGGKRRTRASRKAEAH